MADIENILTSITPTLIPDEVKVKMRFLPSYTWVPGGKPSFLYKLFHPKIYIIKADKAFKFDPLNKEYFKSISIKEVEQEPKFTIFDLIVFGFVSYGVYKSIKAYWPEIKKIGGKNV